MEFKNTIKSYQFPVKQWLAVTIRHRLPYVRKELKTVNAREDVVTNFILKYKDSIIHDYEAIAQLGKTKKTKDIEKHWPIKITIENIMVKNNLLDEFNNILAGQTIPRIILKALEIYYPEKLTFVK